MLKTMLNQKPLLNNPKIIVELNPIWVKFIQYCEKLGFGELQKVQIQDGVPVSAELAMKKVKFI